MLLPYLEANRIEAGCDEAGRGCLARAGVCRCGYLATGLS